MGGYKAVSSFSIFQIFHFPNPLYFPGWISPSTGYPCLYARTSIVSVVSIACFTSSSITSESSVSDFSMAERIGFVTGCFATKMVQQSSNGKIDVSKEPIFFAISTIYTLSIPINGRKTGSSQTAFVVSRLCIVWLATCPMLSPVISPRQSFSFAKCSAIRIM